jgi:uncharacterized membrane protein YqjE
MNEPRRNLLDSTRILLGTALGLLQTRVELLATEIEEEKARLLNLLTFGVFAVVLLSLGTVFFVLTLTALFWDEHPLLILGIFSGGFLALGVVAFFLALRNARPRERLLSATVTELERDRATLRGDGQ